MPKLNPNKCYAQQPLRPPITAPKTLPKNWQSEFYELLSVQLGLNDEKKHKDNNHQVYKEIFITTKAYFLKALDRHAGEQSTYSLKPKLLESLATLYTVFTHPKTTPEKKKLIASRIQDDVNQCSQGFTNRVNSLIIFLNIPQNLDELLACVRFNLVDRIAGIIAAHNTQGIHVHNRVIELARIASYGIYPINTDDIYKNTGSCGMKDETILAKLKTGFDNHFQLFALINALREQLEALIVMYGYNGKRALKTEYKYEEIEKFHECINLFITVKMETLFERDPASDEVIDIHWQQVKRALLRTLQAKQYVTLTKVESLLAKSLLQKKHALFTDEALPIFIRNGYELAQCLEFFSAWRVERKAAFVLAYLKSKSPSEQKDILAILHNEAPQLTVQLKKVPNLQNMYFAIAIAEKDVAAVRAYVEQGADINQALSLLFNEAHKRDTLFWLYEHPILLKKITVTGLDAVIGEGKYKGKSVAQTLAATKKGRQLLLDNNNVLQAALLQTTVADTLSGVLNQAQTERNSVNAPVGFFKKSNPKATQLVQSIVYGDLTKLEALQRDDPSLKTLLGEKVTVKDHSRRKTKQITALQAALCAMDDEACARLAQSMTNEETVRQYQEIFPKGHEPFYAAQTAFDISVIVAVISSSTNADLKQALNLELPNNTRLWKSLEKFRADFTTHSNQESVFNPQHLIHAYELYDKVYNDWRENQRDLFWRQVIGYIQRFLPANIAMDFAQGLYARVNKMTKPNRSFNFTYGSGAIFPLGFNSPSGLGYEYAAVAAGMAGPGAPQSVRAQYFKSYVKKKQQSWEDYAATVESQLSTHLCNSVK